MYKRDYMGMPKAPKSYKTDSDPDKQEEKKRSRKYEATGEHPKSMGSSKKPLSPKQKKIAKKAGDPKKIDAADLAALRNKAKKTRKTK